MGGWRLVTHQRHLGEVYERARQHGGAGPYELAVARVGSRPSRGDGLRGPRTADCDSGLWQRIRGFFRR